MIIVAALIGFTFCVSGLIVFMSKADNNNEMPTNFFSRFLAAYSLFIIGISSILFALVAFLISLIRGS